MERFKQWLAGPQGTVTVAAATSLATAVLAGVTGAPQEAADACLRVLRAAVVPFGW